MSRTITRRRLLNGTVKLALVTPLVHVCPSTATAQTPRLGAAHRRTLRAAADVIIPAHRRMPSAAAVGAVGYIERIAATDAALKQQLLDGLERIELNASTTNGSRFDLLPVVRQVEVLADLERTNTPSNFFPMLRDLVYEAYYTQPRVQQLIGYSFRSGRRRTAPVQPFDERLVARVRRQKATYRRVT